MKKIIALLSAFSTSAQAHKSLCATCASAQLSSIRRARSRCGRPPSRPHGLMDHQFAIVRRPAGIEGSY
jgi:hypothetical protein